MNAKQYQSLREYCQGKQVEMLLTQMQLLDLTHDAIVLLDRQNCITFWNRAAEETYGWKKSEAIGRDIHALLQTQFPTPLEQIEAQVFQAGHWQGELIQTRRDQTPIMIASRWVLQRDEQQGAIAILGINNDITQLKQLETALQQAKAELETRVAERTEALAKANFALQQSEARYRAIVEDQPEMLCRFLADCTLTFVNDAYCRRHGKTREELLGQSFIPLVSQKYQAKVQQQIAALSPENPAVTYDEPFVMPDGEIRWHQWIDRIILDDQGQFVEFQSIGRDITDARSAEQALRESEVRNRALLDVIPDLLFRIRRDGTNLDLKSEHDSNLAIPREQIIGHKFQDYLPPNLAQQRLQFLEKTLDTGNIQTFEYQILINGEWREQESRMVVSGTDEVLAIERDITDRKRTESQLRQQAERDRLLAAISLRIRQSLDLDEILSRTVAEVRQFLQTDRVLIYNFDADNSGILVAASVAPEWNLEQGIDAHKIWYRDTYAAYEQGDTYIVNDVEQQGLTPVYLEFMRLLQVKAKLVVPIVQGEKLWGVVAVQQCSSPRQWQTFETDLLQQLATQVAIAIQQAQLFRQVQQQAQREHLLNQISQALNSSLDPERILQEIVDRTGECFGVDQVVIYTLDGCIQAQQEWRLNREIVSVLNFTAPLEAWPDVLDPDSDFNQHGFFHAPDYRQQPITEVRQQQIEQQLCSVLSVAIFVRGKRFGMLAVNNIGRYRTFTDDEIQLLRRIADQAAIALYNAQSYERLEQLVKERTQELEREKLISEAADRAKSEFLATMSHELRTPLNAILGLSQLLQQEIFGPLNAKQAEYVEHVHSSGNHLLLLINDILDLAKVEAGRETLAPVNLSISELCQHCLALVREQAYERGLQLTSQIHTTVQTCFADERRLKQILLNLLSNAIKFTATGRVSLIVEQQSESIVFTVEDTGIGIAPEKLPLLFRPFSQLDSQLNRQYPGTGLGLALSRNLARLHGGDITVKSTLGKGSCFSLVLPNSSYQGRSPNSWEQGPQLMNPMVKQGWSVGRILIVEDDRCSALLLQDYLQTIGHQVEHSEDGVDFLEQVRNFKPHLILMDVQLSSNYTGMDLLTRIRSQPDLCQTPVVITTAMAMAGDREKFIAAGANDYFSKPLDVVQLESLLMKYV